MKMIDRRLFESIVKDLGGEVCEEVCGETI